MTVIFAKILGIYFLAIGLAFLINPLRFKILFRQIEKDRNPLLIGGIMALLIGAIIISVHNIWVLNWPIIITVLGWWSLIKGFVLLVFPASIKFFSFLRDRSATFYRTISLIYLIFGFFLIYKGLNSSDEFTLWAK